MKPVYPPVFTTDRIYIYIQWAHIPKKTVCMSQAKLKVSQVLVPNQAQRDTPWESNTDITQPVPTLSFVRFRAQLSHIPTLSRAAQPEHSRDTQDYDPLRKDVPQKLVNPDLRQIVRFLNNGLEGVIWGIKTFKEVIIFLQKGKKIKIFDIFKKLVWWKNPENAYPIVLQSLQHNCWNLCNIQNDPPPSFRIRK